MPPSGLYPIGRFHQYGGAPSAKPRPFFNTNDFVDEEPTPAATVIKDAALAVNGLTGRFSEGLAKKGKKTNKRPLGVATDEAEDAVEKKTRKKSKKKVLDKATEAEDFEDQRILAASVAAGGEADVSVLKTKKPKKSEAEKAIEDTTATKSTGKKRKRENEQQAAPLVAVSTLQPGGQVTDTSTALPEWLKQLKSALGTTTETTSTLQPSNLPTPVPAKPAKKKAKLAGKNDASNGTAATQVKIDSAIVQSIDSPAPIVAKTKKRSKKANPDDDGTAGKATLPNSSAVQPTNKSKSTEVKSKKTSKKAKPEESSKVTTSVVPNSSAPSPGSRYAFLVKQSPVPLPQVVGLPSTPTKTPLPLPQTSSHHQKKTNDGADSSEVLVAETPRSQMPRVTPNSWKTPVPFNLDGTSGGLERPTKVPKITFSSPTTVNSGQRRSSAPMTPFINSQEDGISLNQASLTSTNLERYSQPLSDEPKNRPRKRASSVTSSLSSYTIQEAFSRVRSKSLAASPDQQRKKHHVETHEEADAKTFKSAYRVSQKCINFTQEETYLETHLAARAAYNASGPLPCLRQGTGCTAAGEQKLLLAASDTRRFLKAILSTETERTAFDHAVQSTLEAERFLRNTIAARIPVPIGKIEGVYTMYCPKYSATHVDKNSSKRTISIARPRGFKSDTYTAILTVPPRSGFQSTLAFTAPPHASFRMTKLTISNDQGELDIAFLGNGYLLVKMDLGRLIRGKKTKTETGEDSYMEFFCVKEVEAKGKHGPLEWEFGPESAEVKPVHEGDGALGVQGEGSGVSVPSPSPIKRKVGRPTNAELARRAKVAEEQQVKKAGGVT